jgi:VWFA-related protein
MKLCQSLFAILAIAVVPASGVSAPQASAPQTPVIKSTVDEVLLDVVVRDKKGRVIKDLKPDELTITDNGTKQSITGFRLVQGAEAISNTGDKTVLDPLRQLRLVTLAFESMGAPDQRKIARKAAIDLIKGDQGTNVFYSVVVINTQLLVLQQFTQDKAALTAAIERATSGQAIGQLRSESDRIKADLKRYLSGGGNQGVGVSASNVVNGETSGVNTAAGQPANTSSLGSDAVQRKLISVMTDMLRMDSSMTDGSRLTLESLKSLVTGLSSMPGRKSILYFTWGIYLPTHLDEMFRNLMSTANRANVTFYSVESSGVKTWAQNAGAAHQLSGAANDAAAAMNRNAGTTENRVTTAEILASDNAESAGRNNVQLPLRDLAEATGGFLIGDSNDLSTPLRRVNEEINSYYEVSYNPGITNYDGSFRKLKVDVERKDTVVHSRNGYFALAPEVRAAGLQAFEVPILKVLSDGAFSKDVDFRSAALLLQPKPEGTDVSILVEVPLKNLQTKADPAKNTLNVHFALAALVKDSLGEVVQKLTRDRSLQVTAEQIKAGNFTEKFSAEIPAGKYTLESAVMDRESMKIGAQKAEFVVTPRAKGVGISSMTPVRAYSPNAKGLDPNEPFQFQGGVITPMLSNSVTRSEQGVLPLFFTVYPDAAAGGKASVDIEFFQNGQSLQKGTLPLPDPDSLGRIPYVFSVPASIPPGTYEIHATARQGSTSAEAKAVVKVEAQ